MQFRNREDAGRLLADRLERFRGQKTLVLGIPRGRVPRVAVVAERLGADLDVMLVHKLRTPIQPELAFGSIDETGEVYLAPFAAEFDIAARDLDQEKRLQLSVLEKRRASYSAVRPPLDLTGRTVILVDDGLATGSTAIAAVRSARSRRAARVIVAVGVAPPATISRLRSEADEVVCLHSPPAFSSVGQFFADFSEVTDDDVTRVLAESVSRHQVGG